MELPKRLDYLKIIKEEFPNIVQVFPKSEEEFLNLNEDNSKKWKFKYEFLNTLLEGLMNPITYLYAREHNGLNFYDHFLYDGWWDFLIKKRDRMRRFNLYHQKTREILVLNINHIDENECYSCNTLREIWGKNSGSIYCFWCGKVYCKACYERLRIGEYEFECQFCKIEKGGTVF